MNREGIINELFKNMSTVFRLACSHAPHEHTKKMPTRAQIGVLMLIAHHGPKGIKDLAEKMGMSSSAATQLVNGLVKEKFVMRKPSAEDRRKILVSMTDKGVKMLQEAKKKRIDGLRTVLEPLTNKELMQWMKLQEKIINSRTEHAS